MSDGLTSAFLSALGILAVAMLVVIGWKRDLLRNAARMRGFGLFLAILLAVFGSLFLAMVGPEIGASIAAALYVVAGIILVLSLVEKGLLANRQAVGRRRRRATMVLGLIMIAVGVIFKAYTTPGDALAFIPLAISGVGLLVAWIALVSFSDREPHTEGMQGR